MNSSFVVGQKLEAQKVPVSPLLKACDEHLLDVIDIIGVTRVIGIGKYAEQRARLALGAGKTGSGTSRGGRSIRINTCWHPSPASPLANRNDGEDWRKNVINCLES